MFFEASFLVSCAAMKTFVKQKTAGCFWGGRRGYIVESVDTIYNSVALISSGYGPARKKMVRTSAVTYDVSYPSGKHSCFDDRGTPTFIVVFSEVPQFGSSPPQKNNFWREK